MKADGIHIELRGDKELIRKLDRLAKRDANKALRRGLRAAAKMITERAKQLVPTQTQALRRAIRTRAGKRSRRYIAVVSTISKRFLQGESFYAGFQEFGWHPGKRVAKTRGAAGRRWIEGAHFMQRAAEQKGRAASRRALEIIKQEIEAAARR